MELRRSSIDRRAWAAVLFSWPAAPNHESALRAADGGRAGDEVLWNLSPPRVRYELTAIDVAAEAAANDFAAIALLAKAVQSRRTTAQRMLDAMASRPRLRRHRWIEGVLRDIAEGTCSVLEHGYLTRVERPHGLPRAHRQAIGSGRVGRVYRDADYGGYYVELDGRLDHDSAEGRDTDCDRDLVAQVAGGQTSRLS